MTLENATVYVGYLDKHYSSTCPVNVTILAQNVHTCDPFSIDDVMYFMRLLVTFNATIQFVLFQHFGSWQSNDTSLTSALLCGRIDMAYFGLILTEQRQKGSL